MDKVWGFAKNSRNDRGLYAEVQTYSLESVLN